MFMELHPMSLLGRLLCHISPIPRVRLQLSGRDLVVDCV